MNGESDRSFKSGSLCKDCMINTNFLARFSMNSRPFMHCGLCVAFLATLAVPSKPQSSVQRESQEPVQLKATLVQVPVTVTDQAGRFVVNLSRNDFAVYEENKRQEVSVFSALKQPYTAALVLDTSNSASDRLTAIQNLAIGFTHELTGGDRMMVITFDNEVRKLTDFTSDQSELESSIKSVESGFGKLLYEAVRRGLEELRDVEGRRAVILFSDGVDMKSIDATAAQVMQLADEVGAVVYVVRTETRWWVEAEARKHQTATSDERFPVQIDGRIPLPPDYGGPDPTPTGMPRPRAPRIEIGPPQLPTVVVNGKRIEGTGANKPADPISDNLDKLYGEADDFIQQITLRTGGKVFASETFAVTRSAFAAVADELRNQYLLGYYPSVAKKDSRYRRIKVEVTRKDARVRARPGYKPTD